MRTTALLSSLALFSSVFSAPLPTARIPGGLVARSARASSASATPTAPSKGIGATPKGFSIISDPVAASKFGVAAASAAAALSTNEAAVAAAASSTASAAASSSSKKSSSSSSSGSSRSSGSSESSKPSESSASSGSESGSSTSAAAALDLVVLNLAATLEALETEFYTTGLATFSKSDMISAGLTEVQADIIIQTMTAQLNDETTHAKTLKAAIGALGGKVNDKCKFDFSSVMSNPATFIAAARSIEVLGVMAYAGAANLIDDPTILTVAATILAIEARHESGLNLFAGGTFTPQSFDYALRPEQTLAVAGGFLKGCTPEDLGLTSNAPLSVVDANTGTSLISIGSQLAFASPVLDASTDASKLTCHMLITGQPTAIVQPLSKCVVPEGVNGPIVIYASNDSTPLQSNIIQQNTAQIAAGPGVFFVDSSSETFQQLFSIQGFGIQKLASVDMGSITVVQETIINIIEESQPGQKMKHPVDNGIVVANRKRGYQAEGATIVGWST